MPTPEPTKIVINGEVVSPINKRKLPLDVDWQAKIREKRDEVKKP